jgi:uncharacterized membrane protein YecN with MAPEG domain
MSKPFTHIAGLVLLIVALVHAYRLYAGLTVVIAGHDIPMWVSWPAAIVGAILAIMVFREAQRP